MLQEDDVSPRTTEPPFLSAILAKNDTTNLFGYKLGESSENNKTLLFFSGKQQFRLLTVPFKLLRCCLRSDKLVNFHVWKFCKDLFLNFRVFWSVNQMVLFNGFLSDFVEITLSIYTKIIILFHLGEQWRQEYLTRRRVRVSVNIHPRFTSISRNNC